MSRIDRETVRKILDTADIVEVVSDFVKLRRTGANYMGLCPFHNERTPSFSVSKSRGICKCFSCGKGGTPVGFIMELEQLSYVEALKWLAKKYNIEVKEHEMTDEEREASNERESMLALNDFALQFFERTLTDTDEGRNVGLSYFRHRGLSDAVVKRFRLGFAPEKRDAFSTEAMAKGYSEKTLADTGLCAKSERGSLYDRFRGRVMFPVFSVSGKVVAFGGRTLKTDKTVAKYVNSPESLIYHKSSELYGLYQAKREIIKKDKCILVEGYMDVISMSQRGVENIVASSGTSLTEGQIALIHRFTENVTVIYDADPAGIKASLRGIDMLLAHGMHIKVMLLPEGEDPDSFAKSHSLEEIEAYMKENETDFIRFKTRILLDSLSEGDPIGRAGVINSIARSISVIPDRVERSEYIKLCARLLESDEEVITLQVAKYMNEAADKRASQTRQQQPEEVREVTAAVKPATRSTIDQKAYMRPSEMELVRLLARFGLQTMAMVVDADGDETELSALDYVRGELDNDEIRLTNPDLEKVYYAVIAAAQNWPVERVELERRADEVAAQRRLEAREEILAAGSMEAMKIKEDELEKHILLMRDAFMAEGMERYLTATLGADPDDDVRRLSTAFVSEKYTLSKIHTKNIHIPSERELLPQKAPRAVCGVKIATLQWREKELRAQFAKPGADVASILAELQSIRGIISQLAHYLGERIILPK